jgi:hypothetical protein
MQSAKIVEINSKDYMYWTQQQTPNDDAFGYQTQVNPSLDKTNYSYRSTYLSNIILKNRVKVQ